MRCDRVLHVPLLFLFVVGPGYGRGLDSDRDGLPDELEQALLLRFSPTFHISGSDCDVAPAEFHPDLPNPTVKGRNGTVYGQVFPVRRGGHSGDSIEIHFYHLWSRDCGLNGHALDAESVSALLRADGDASNPEAWRAEFWYAAAHENTLCDMSNGATAAALDASDHGPDIWVSRDKHASFLSRELCARGCGRDQCDSGQTVRASNLVNLGEPGAPMNGTSWSASVSWPLASKMEPRYTSALIERMPTGREVEVVPARDVVRGGRTTIKVAGHTYGALASANAGTGSAISTSAGRVGQSLDAASTSASKSVKHVFRTIKRGLHPGS